jgi:hypothetical protein
MTMMAASVIAVLAFLPVIGSIVPFRRFGSAADQPGSSHKAVAFGMRQDRQYAACRVAALTS